MSSPELYSDTSQLQLGAGFVQDTNWAEWRGVVPSATGWPWLYRVAGDWPWRAQGHFTRWDSRSIRQRSGVYLRCTWNNFSYHYTPCLKKTVPTYYLLSVCQIWTNFNKNWEDCLSRRKPLTKLCLKCPLHLKYVLALPWEIWSVRLSRQRSN